MCILYTLHNIVYLLKDKIHNVDIVRVVLDIYLCWFILWADLDTQLIPLLCFFTSMSISTRVFAIPAWCLAIWCLLFQIRGNWMLSRFLGIRGRGSWDWSCCANWDCWKIFTSCSKRLETQKIYFVYIVGCKFVCIIRSVALVAGE